MYKCATCDNVTTCTSCPTSSNRNTGSSTCACSTGFYDDNTSICKAVCSILLFIGNNVYI